MKISVNFILLFLSDSESWENSADKEDSSDVRDEPPTPHLSKQRNARQLNARTSAAAAVDDRAPKWDSPDKKSDGDARYIERGREHSRNVLFRI